MQIKFFALATVLATTFATSSATTPETTPWGVGGFKRGQYTRNLRHIIETGMKS